MAIKKPGWLKSWLNRLNWDIFTWQVYIGDAMEDSIDWALDWINWGIDLAGDAYDKALDSWFKALEIARDLTSKINTWIQAVTDRISTWWDDLGEWWSAKRQDVLDWIDVARDWLLDRIDQVRDLANYLEVAWEGFKRDTLPGLLDTAWIRDFFGAGISSINEWWLARRQEIDDIIEAITKPIRDELNKYLETLSSAKQLFSDPLAWPDQFARWVFNWIESIIARIF